MYIFSSNTLFSHEIGHCSVPVCLEDPDVIFYDDTV